MAAALNAAASPAPADGGPLARALSEAHNVLRNPAKFLPADALQALRKLWRAVCVHGSGRHRVFPPHAEDVGSAEEANRLGVLALSVKGALFEALRPNPNDKLLVTLKKSAEEYRLLREELARTMEGLVAGTRPALGGSAASPSEPDEPRVFSRARLRIRVLYLVANLLRLLSPDRLPEGLALAPSPAAASAATAAGASREILPVALSGNGTGAGADWVVPDPLMVARALGLGLVLSCGDLPTLRAHLDYLHAWAGGILPHAPPFPALAALSALCEHYPALLHEYYAQQPSAFAGATARFIGSMSVYEWALAPPLISALKPSTGRRVRSMISIIASTFTRSSPNAQREADGRPPAVTRGAHGQPITVLTQSPDVNLDKGRRVPDSSGTLTVPDGIRLQNLCFPALARWISMLHARSSSAAKTAAARPLGAEVTACLREYCLAVLRTGKLQQVAPTSSSASDPAHPVAALPSDGNAADVPASDAQSGAAGTAPQPKTNMLAAAAAVAVALPSAVTGTARALLRRAARFNMHSQLSLFLTGGGFDFGRDYCTAAMCDAVRLLSELCHCDEGQCAMVERELVDLVKPASESQHARQRASGTERLESLPDAPLDLSALPLDSHSVMGKPETPLAAEREPLALRDDDDAKVNLLRDGERDDQGAGAAREDSGEEEDKKEKGSEEEEDAQEQEEEEEEEEEQEQEHGAHDKPGEVGMAEIVLPSELRDGAGDRAGGAQQRSARPESSPAAGVLSARESQQQDDDAVDDDEWVRVSGSDAAQRDEGPDLTAAERAGTKLPEATLQDPRDSSPKPRRQERSRIAALSSALFGAPLVGEIHASVVLALVDLGLEHGRRLLRLNAVDLLASFFQRRLSQQYTDPLVAFETLSLCLRHAHRSKVLAVMERFSPLLLKILAFQPSAFAEHFVQLVHILVSERTCEHLLQAILDLPLLTATIEFFLKLRRPQHQASLRTFSKLLADNQNVLAAYQYVLRNTTSAPQKSQRLSRPAPEVMRSHQTWTRAATSQRLRRASDLVPVLLGVLFKRVLQINSRSICRQVLEVVVSRFCDVYLPFFSAGEIHAARATDSALSFSFEAAEQQSQQRSQRAVPADADMDTERCVFSTLSDMVLTILSRHPSLLVECRGPLSAAMMEEFGNPKAEGLLATTVWAAGEFLATARVLVGKISCLLPVPLRFHPTRAHVLLTEHTCVVGSEGHETGQTAPVGGDVASADATDAYLRLFVRVLERLLPVHSDREEEAASRQEFLLQPPDCLLGLLKSRRRPAALPVAVMPDVTQTPSIGVRPGAQAVPRTDDLGRSRAVATATALEAPLLSGQAPTRLLLALVSAMTKIAARCQEWAPLVKASLARVQATCRHAAVVQRARVCQVVLSQPSVAHALLRLPTPTDSEEWLFTTSFIDDSTPLPMMTLSAALR